MTKSSISKRWDSRMNWIMIAVVVPAAVFTITRFPTLGERRNRMIAAAGLLLITSFLGMNPVIYSWIDDGRHNLADILVKGALFAALNIVGSELARAHGNRQLAQRLIGCPGWSLWFAFILVQGALLGILSPSAPISTPALEAYLSNPVVVIYNSIACFYPAVIGALLMRLLLQTARLSSVASARKLGAILSAAGFGLAFVGAVLLPFVAMNHIGYRIDQVINAVAALLVIAGLVLAWVEMSRRAKSPISQSSLRV